MAERRKPSHTCSRFCGKTGHTLFMPAGKKGTCVTAITNLHSLFYRNNYTAGGSLRAHAAHASLCARVSVRFCRHESELAAVCRSGEMDAAGQ